MELAGKKAIIFGGTSGIGLAAAKQMVDKGAEVIAISRDPSKAGDVPAGITLKACDVRDRDALAKLFEECAPFDILVSSATGGSRSVGPFMDQDMDAFQGSFDKLWGYANIVRFGAGHLAEPRHRAADAVDRPVGEAAQLQRGATGGPVDTDGRGRADAAEGCS